MSSTAAQAHPDESNEPPESSQSSLIVPQPTKDSPRDHDASNVVDADKVSLDQQESKQTTKRYSTVELAAAEAKLPQVEEPPSRALGNDDLSDTNVMTEPRSERDRKKPPPQEETPSITLLQEPSSRALGSSRTSLESSLEPEQGTAALRMDHQDERIQKKLAQNSGKQDRTRRGRTKQSGSTNSAASSNQEEESSLTAAKAPRKSRRTKEKLALTPGAHSVGSSDDDSFAHRTNSQDNDPSGNEEEEESPQSPVVLEAYAVEEEQEEPAKVTTTTEAAVVVNAVPDNHKRYKLAGMVGCGMAVVLALILTLVLVSQNSSDSAAASSSPTSTTSSPTTLRPTGMPTTPSMSPSQSPSASPTIWIPQEVTKLVANDGQGGDQFGYSVAMDQDTLVVGAFRDGINQSGNVFVFIRTHLGDWIPQAKLDASDAAAGDLFGASVAVDGDTLVVGAYFNDDGGINSGSAYVFVRDNTAAWSEQAKLTAEDAAAGDLFGISVAISGDLVVVGAVGDDDGGFDSGSAYVFRRDSSTLVWSQQAKLTANDAGGRDNFGTSVDVDGETIVVGANSNAEGGLLASGSVYVFVLEDGVSSWIQQAKLRASDATVHDMFGTAVAIHGETMVVGTPEDSFLSSWTGSAYVFVRVDTEWTEQAKLTADDGADGDQFGFDVAVDGETIVVGAFGDDGSGSAYVFERVNTTSWSQLTKLVASDAEADSFFGLSVAISNSRIVVGAHLDDDDSGATDKGSVYVFE